VTAELNDGAPAHQRVNRKRVTRVMAERGLAGIRLRRKVRTTIPEPSDQHVPDLLNRDFTAQTPNTKYVGDMPTGGICRRLGGGAGHHRS
jgi:transposase InsO family protein